MRKERVTKGPLSSSNALILFLSQNLTIQELESMREDEHNCKWARQRVEDSKFSSLLDSLSLRGWGAWESKSKKRDHLQREDSLPALRLSITLRVWERETLGDRGPKRGRIWVWRGTLYLPFVLSLWRMKSPKRPRGRVLEREGEMLSLLLSLSIL